MNNNDERDYAEEAHNARIAHDDVSDVDRKDQPETYSQAAYRAAQAAHRAPGDPAAPDPGVPDGLPPAASPAQWRDTLAAFLTSWETSGAPGSEIRLLWHELAALVAQLAVPADQVAGAYRRGWSDGYDDGLAAARTADAAAAALQLPPIHLATPETRLEYAQRMEGIAEQARQDETTAPTPGHPPGCTCGDCMYRRQTTVGAERRAWFRAAAEQARQDETTAPTPGHPPGCPGAECIYLRVIAAGGTGVEAEAVARRPASDDQP